MVLRRTGQRWGTCRRLLGWTWLLAFLLVAQAPWRPGHDATTVHVVCAEHGELVDVDLAEAIDELSHERSAEEASPESDSSQDPGGEEEHEHCRLPEKDQPKSHPPRLIPACLGLVQLAVAAVQPPAVPQRAIDVLQVAPKQSPPS